jgi:excisionase family DNA binding protein
MSALIETAYVRSFQTEVEGYVTAETVAWFLNVEVDWVHEYARPGRPIRLPSYQFGRYRRFRLSEVEAWAQARLCD